MVMLMVSSVVLSTGQKPSSLYPSQSKGQFVMGPRAALMPPGTFLLIRKDGHLGAVRFTSIDVTDGSQGLGKASYESFFQEDEKKGLQDQSTVKKTGGIN